MLMRTLSLRFSLFRKLSNPILPLPYLSFFSSLTAAPKQPSKSTSSSTSRPFIFDYLVQSFGFPEELALSVSTRFSYIKSREKPESVVHLFKELGFSDAHIVSSVRNSPQILFTDVEKTLKPKLQFLQQQLGFSGSDLGKFLSKNSTVLTLSLDNKLKPCVETLKQVLGNDCTSEDLFRVVRRCNWILSKDPQSRFLSNVSYLKSCGIVGSQLNMLLVRQPRLFMMQESAVKEVVSRALDMNFSIDSRMFVHGFYSALSVSNETFMRKLKLFCSFGFSESEFMLMIRKAPTVLRTSEEKLKFAIEFYLNNLGLDKSALVKKPTCFMHSMEDKVIPRFRVLKVMKSKGLLKKEPSFFSVLDLTEGKFLEKFIFKFRDNVEELLAAYKGHSLVSA